MIGQLGKSLTEGIYRIKGDVYIKDFAFGWYRMTAITDENSNQLTDKYVSLYLGTKAHYYVFSL